MRPSRRQQLTEHGIRLRHRAIAGAARLLAAWPDWLRIALADVVAVLACVLPNRRQRRARDNIRRCLKPEPAERGRLLYRHLQHRADSLFELGMLWHWPLERLLRRVAEVHGWEVLLQAGAQGRGVLVAVPHFGSWELASLYLGWHLENTALLYKPGRKPELDDLLSRFRARAGSRVLPANRRGIAGMIRVLDSGGYAGLLPDQRPAPGAGQPAELFGRRAMTMTLLVRLARRSGSPVVFAGARRLPDRRRFALHILQAPDAIHSADDAVALRAMNRGIEAVAALAPAQYQWSYNRFEDGVSS